VFLCNITEIQAYTIVWLFGCFVMLYQVVPWLRQLVVGLSPWIPSFSLRPVHVEFLVDKVTMG
jgi:hypothetical protein